MILDAGGIPIPIDDAPGRNLRPPLASHLRECIRFLNSVGATHHRVLFCQHDAAQGNASPIHRYRYNDNFGNGRRLRYNALALPPFTAAPAIGTPMPKLTTSIGGEIPLWGIEATITEPEDLIFAQLAEDVPGGPSGGMIARHVNTVDGFPLVALAIIEHPMIGFGNVDTAWGGAMNPARFAALGAVTDDPLIALRLLEDELWMDQRPVLAAWSATGFTVGAARSVAGTTLTNLIDGTTGARTEATAGEVCPAQNAGRGTSGSVVARCAAYCQTTAGTGSVTFRARNDTVTATATTTAGWREALAISLDATQEYDKVDIVAAANAAPDTVRVWAWMIQIDPA